MLLVMILGLTLWSEEGGLVWRESTRDIYVDGRHEREARLFYNGTRKAYVLALPGVRKRILIEKDGAKQRLYHVARKDFRISADRLEAGSDETFTRVAAGEARVIEERHLLFETQGRTVLIARHDGPSGPIEREGLDRAATSWRAHGLRHAPDPAALAAFKAVSEPTKLTVFFGTWCGDSKNHVPKLLRTLDMAGNAQIECDLVAISSDFSQPWDAIRENRITNVPTVLVTRGEGELGRFVESPRKGSIEADLADIFSGGVLASDAVAEATLEVEGTFSHADGGDAESWRWYRRDRGDHLLHATLERDNATIRIRMMADEERRPTFLEITEDHLHGLQRTRYFIEDGGISAIRRGSDTGIARLTLHYGGRLFLETPSAFINGWQRGGPEAPEPNPAATGLHVGHELGRLMPPEVATEFIVLLETTAGTVEARKQVSTHATWWIDRSTGLPLLCDRGGVRAELSSFRWQRKGAGAPGR